MVFFMFFFRGRVGSELFPISPESELFFTKDLISERGAQFSACIAIYSRNKRHRRKSS